MLTKVKETSKVKIFVVMVSKLFGRLAFELGKERNYNVFYRKLPKLFPIVSPATAVDTAVADGKVVLLTFNGRFFAVAPKSMNDEAVSANVRQQFVNTFYAEAVKAENTTSYIDLSEFGD